MAVINREGQIVLQARSLFNRALNLGRGKALWARLLGRSRELRFLGDVSQQRTVTTHEPLGVQPVRLSRIVGSQGKADDFDSEFFPRNRYSQDRWLSVAIAMLADVTSLPPVELVQVGDSYYVIDGHHRVSVARTLGYLFIDADVTRWEVEDSPA